MTDPGWQDVTYPIRGSMPSWPGQPPVELSALSTLTKPGESNVSSLRMSLHTGTHLDAPCHFVGGAGDVTSFPPEMMTGPVRVIDATKADPHIDAATVDRAHDDESITRGERLFFRTANSRRDWTAEPFDKRYVAVAPDAARRLVELGVAMIGVDYLSVAPFDDPATTHRVLLHAGVWVVEGLDLRAIEAGRYDALCAPLPIEGGDASPLRVMLRALTA